MSGTSIPPKTKMLLAGRAAGRCEYRGCNKVLTEDDLTRRTGNFSAFAHIVADSPDGPRGDPIRSPQLATDIDNLMLMCLQHHKLIDVDDVDGHPEKLLLEHKHLHEERVRRLTEIDDQHQTLIVLFEAGIGGRKGLVDVQQSRNAALPLYPADEFSIPLATLRTRDGTTIFWEAAMAELDEAAREIHSRLVRQEAKHLSVFALAPIPLLMYLGRVLGDIPTVTAFQRHRDPGDWTWKPPSGQEQPFGVVPPDEASEAQHIALVLSISDNVDRQLVSEHAPDNAPIYELRIPRPATDAIRAAHQVVEFRNCLRQLLSQIKGTHGGRATLHIYPAVPNSIAVAFGLALLPKADLAMDVYDFNRDHGGWIHALTLLGAVDARS